MSRWFRINSRIRRIARSLAYIPPWEGAALALLNGVNFKNTPGALKRCPYSAEKREVGRARFRVGDIDERFVSLPSWPNPSAPRISFL